MLVLVQRGRGGGLSARWWSRWPKRLGTKAGDVFTRITIVVAAIWIFLCAAAVRTLNPSNSDAPAGLTKASATMGSDEPKNTGDTKSNSTKSDSTAVRQLWARPRLQHQPTFRQRHPKPKPNRLCPPRQQTHQPLK